MAVAASVVVLLDTHALLWWLDGDARLSDAARAAIAEPDRPVFVSAASAWEITTKHRLDKLPGAEDVAQDVAGCIATQRFGAMAIRWRTPSAPRPQTASCPKSTSTRASAALSSAA